MYIVGKVRNITFSNHPHSVKLRMGALEICLSVLYKFSKQLFDYFLQCSIR